MSRADEIKMRHRKHAEFVELCKQGDYDAVVNRLRTCEWILHAEEDGDRHNLKLALEDGSVAAAAALKARVLQLLFSEARYDLDRYRLVSRMLYAAYAVLNPLRWKCAVGDNTDIIVWNEVGNVDVREAHHVVCLNDNTLIPLFLQRGEVWHAYRFVGVPRRLLAQNSGQFDLWISEGEAEVACAKECLLNSTTLPLAVIEMIVQLM